MEGGIIIEKDFKRNSIELTGVISRIGDIHKNASEKDFLYFDIAQGKNSFFSVYVEGKALKDFKDQNLQVKDRINVKGVLNSYLKDGKSKFQIFPIEMQKLEKVQVKEENREQEMDI